MGIFVEECVYHPSVDCLGYLSIRECYDCQLSELRSLLRHASAMVNYDRKSLLT